MKGLKGLVSAVACISLAGCVALNDLLGAEAVPHDVSPTTNGAATAGVTSSTMATPVTLLNRDISFGELVTPRFGGLVDGTLVIKAPIKYCCDLRDEISVEFLVGGTRIDHKEFIPNSTSGENTIDFKYIPRRSSRLEVVLRIDPDNKIAEDNKGNNVATASIDIFPNLSAAVNVSTISVTPAFLRVGASASVSTEIFYCCNPEYPIEVEFWVDGEKLSVNQFRGQEAGTESLRFDWLPKVATTSVITLIADPRNLIRKRFQNFNIATMSIKVGS